MVTYLTPGTHGQGPAERPHGKGSPTLTGLDKGNICTTCDDKPRNSEDTGVGGHVHSEPFISPICLHTVSGSQRAPPRPQDGCPQSTSLVLEVIKSRGKNICLPFTSPFKGGDTSLRSPFSRTLLPAEAGLLCLIGQKRVSFLFLHQSMTSELSLVTMTD